MSHPEFYNYRMIHVFYFFCLVFKRLSAFLKQKLTPFELFLKGEYPDF